MSENAPPPPPGGGGYGSPPPPPPPGYGPPGGYGGQPGGYGGPPPGSAPPPNNLVWAILSTLFCCLPLGIAAIVFAAQVNGKWAAGDIAGAQASAQKARQFALWSTIVGAVLIVLYLVIVFATGASMYGTS
jgi:predicted secreted protein